VKPSKYQPFRAWLEAHGYRESTARLSASEVALAERSYRERKPPEHTQASLRRYAAYLAAPGTASAGEFTAWVRANYVAAPVRKPGRRERKHVAESYHPEEWDKLREYLAHETQPEARVLQVQAATGLRIGDVLRLEWSELKRALRTRGLMQLEVKGGHKRAIPLDGALDAWRRLAEDWDGETERLAEWISPRGQHAAEGGFGAYRAVYDYLREAATLLGLTGRAHPHRLRRTVAVQALRVSKDIHNVKKLLGHANISSTERYVDEADHAGVVALQQQLNAPHRSPVGE